MLYYILADSRFKTTKSHIDFVVKRDKLPFDIAVEAKLGVNLEQLERIGIKLLGEKQYHLGLCWDKRFDQVK